MGGVEGRSNGRAPSFKSKPKSSEMGKDNASEPEALLPNIEDALDDDACGKPVTVLRPRDTAGTVGDAVNAAAEGRAGVLVEAESGSRTGMGTSFSALLPSFVVGFEFVVVGGSVDVFCTALLACCL